MIFLLAIEHASVAKGQWTPEEIRTRYQAARPSLEAIWDAPAHYTFKNTIKRYDIPQDMVGKIQPGNLIEYDVYHDGDRWRFDMRSTIEDKVAESVCVSNGKKQSYFTKKPGDKIYTLADTEGQSRMFEEKLKTMKGLCEVACILPMRLDVKDVLFGPNYKFKVVEDPASQGQAGVKTVTIEFERVPKSDPNEKVKQFLYDSGRITLLPELNWAIDHYSLVANTGLAAEGRVTYQTVEKLNSRLVPKLVEATTINGKSSLKTTDRTEVTAIVPGPISDEILDLANFQPPKSLEVKQSEGWNDTTPIIALGVVLIVAAILIRILAQRRKTN
jgi:hypothetical protein